MPTPGSWRIAMETGADLVSADAHFEYIDEIAWVRVPAD